MSIFVYDHIRSLRRGLLCNDQSSQLPQSWSSWERRRPLSLNSTGKNQAGPSEESGDRTITLIHLNDLHANLVPHLDLVRAVPEEGGNAVAPNARVTDYSQLAQWPVAPFIQPLNPDSKDAEPLARTAH